MLEESKEKTKNELKTIFTNFKLQLKNPPTFETLVDRGIERLFEVIDESVINLIT